MKTSAILQLLRNNVYSVVKIPSQCSEKTMSQISDGIEIETGQKFRSAHVRRFTEAAELGCKSKNRESCHTLANLCVLQNYNRDAATSCTLYESLFRTNPSSSDIPALFFLNSEASIELFRESAIDAHFDFVHGAPNSQMNFQLATYTFNGTFLGFHPLTDGIIQQCPTDTDRKEGAFKFGRMERDYCRINLAEVIKKYHIFFGTHPYELLFHELYLKYADRQGTQKIYNIPIVNENIRYSGQFVNRADSRQDSKWILTRRFYIVDEQIEPDLFNALVRVPVHISLHIQIQRSLDGRIFPPYMRIRHNQYYFAVDNKSAVKEVVEQRTHEEHADFLFQTIYVIDSFVHDKTIEVIMATLSCTCVLWGAVKAYSWGRRAGKLMVDASTVIKFLLYVAENLGNIFLLIAGCTAVWITFAYKLQKEMVYVVLTYEQEWSLVIYICCSCGLKAIALVHTYMKLIFTETFFVDWERPRHPVDRSHETTMLEMTQNDLLSHKTRKTPPVVIWRTYLIANEWNELQYYRKTSVSLQMIAMLFFLDLFRFSDWAIVQPGFGRGDPVYAETRMTRFAVNLAAYIAISMTQWITNVLIIEKIADPFRNFMDLCSVANISVLALTHPLRAYYIHGRSVHGLADTDMLEMNMFLQREKENLCGLRGLESNSELQTFVACLPRAFRERLDELTGALRTVSQGPQVRMIGGDKTTAKVANTAKIHAEINQFVKDFIDHADQSTDYIVSDPKLIEEILDIELNDTSKVGTLIRDPSEMGYSACFVYGNEWSHLSFELLLFCVLDMFLLNRILSATVVFAVSTAVTSIAKTFFTNSLVKSSLVDHRFLI
ncbi:unnamed protein product [Bursaphelenchus okinawaensis]|uniref:Meckelin n=1 Tax=Bursaphelenchus okinawaensis TaxID=465554 RepID=A0A811JSE2_9BILA|nr:unnamed protein product [Bursaphelenchus okinawaensis]CAG9081045.1 unnamed protein product [Bursaphelenchus okinawaensis]